MLTPHTAFEKLRKIIRPQHITAFIAALVTGIIAHGYVIMNYIPNWDGFNNLYDAQNKPELGRCFLTLSCGISSYYDLPWISGLLSILYISLTAAILVQILRLTRTASCIFTGAILASFPAVTSIMGYSYTSDGYFLAMLLMTIAVYLSIQKKSGILRCVPAAGLVCIALGTYQAFLAFALMIILVWTVKYLLFDLDGEITEVTGSTPSDMKYFALCMRNFAVSFGIGFIAYIICSKVLQIVQGVTAADYQGINEVGSFSISGFISGFGRALVDFTYYYVGSLSKLGLYGLLNIFLTIILAGSIVFFIVKKKIYKEPLRLIILILAIAMMPFACFAIHFVSGGVSYHSLMIMGMSLIFVMLAVMYEQFGAPLYKWLVIVLLSVVVWNYVLIANICYRVEETSVTRSMAVLDDIADAIAEEGAQSATNLIVVGSWDENETGRFSSSSSINLPPEITGFTDGIIMTGANHFANLLNDYYGYDYRILAKATEQEYMGVHEEEIRTMPEYPENGCVSVIDNVVVIKLSGVK
ncbi:MAG: glucosyltransferase domain-containing protein [Lachnospiraceae bacterium]|nr:glucosyltransferase domain-containing protein [Candidatus Merdinaster equi]